MNTIKQAREVDECLAVLRPKVKGKWPQEQALEELAGYLAAGAQPAPKQSHGFTEIKPEDFKVEVLYKSTGGGFAPISSNGVRVTHILSGTSVDCDSERSQYANREKALQTLLEILAENQSTTPVQAQEQRKPHGDGSEEFKQYLVDCDKNAIEPDVAGAFNAGWLAANGIKEQS